MDRIAPHWLEDLFGGLVCIVVLATMIAENPWSLLLIALCAIVT